jgi:replicative DNA helicase Mcm
MTEIQIQNPTALFMDFLKSYQDPRGEHTYRQKLQRMAIDGSTSLVVDFEDLLNLVPELARHLIDEPSRFLPYAEQAAYNQLKIEATEYADSVERVHVRFSKLPVTTPLRFMGSDHLGTMITIDGILVRATTVRPMLTKGLFRCRRCGNEMLHEQTGMLIATPPLCTNPACGRTGPFDLVEEGSKFINSQRIRVQEKPEDLPPGQLPRWVDASLLDELVDIARPGDRMSIVGVPRPIRQGNQRLFDISLEANFIDVAGKEHEVVQITEEEEEQIRELSKDPRIHEKIVRSTAPSIYGYEDIKEALVYLLFGGVPKQMADGITIRGDVNVLLIGDPGTAKSQLLKYVSKIAPRGLYTSGRGSTAAGLTAAVIRESPGGMTLEAGALVIADRGVCAVDEIDKMRTEDRVAIHEAMEQQTVSIAKGGIVATLNARTSILAAANPSLGRFDPYRTVAENINLPVTILSRFDVIFVIKDQPDRDVDEKTAEHILALHKMGSAPVEPPIAPQLLRKYVSYAKQIEPVLTEAAMERVKDFYMQMRTTESRDSPIAITARQLESLIRLAEARARAALREEVSVEDAQAAILLARKSLEQVGIDLSSGKIDIDIIMTGRPKSLRDKLQAVLSTIVDAEKTTGMISEEDLYERAREEYDLERSEASRLLKQLTSDGMVYSPRQGYYKKT